jgi:hypothetical protein
VANGACTTLGPETNCGQYVCSGTSCRQTCSSNTDCALGSFCDSPSCLAQCAAPDSSNLVRNAGFDRTADGFAPGTWQSEDSVGCATSGSLYVYPNSRSEVFAVTGSAAYHVGFWAKNFSINAGSSCDLEWCSSTFCGTQISIDTLQVPATLGWQKVSSMVTAPGTAVAARFTCRSGGVNLDRFFVSTKAARY